VSWYEHINELDKLGPLNLFPAPQFGEDVFLDQQERSKLLVSKYLDGKYDNIITFDGHGRFMYSMCDVFIRVLGYVPNIIVQEIVPDVQAWHELFFPPGTSNFIDIYHYSLGSGFMDNLHYFNFCGFGGNRELQIFVNTLIEVANNYENERSRLFNIVVSYCPRGITNKSGLKTLEEYLFNVDMDQKLL
jgi:hypothetical protein